jgi:hypothetical protein
MAWLVEDPLMILIVGAAVEAVLLIALVNTGRGELLYAMIAVGVVVAALLMVERLVVTDRERVQQTLHSAAKALETNDVEAVIAHIAPDAAPMRHQVRAILPLVEVREARISGLKITFNELTIPPTATAEFVGRVNARWLHGTAPRDQYLARFTVTLEPVGDRWLMTDYQMRDLQ